MEFESIFERQEKKFIVTDRERTEILSRLACFMHPDEYGESTVYSLYFDTPSSRLVRTSNEHPTYKEKLRLRSYGKPDADTVVFLELKKKYCGIVYKRRIELLYSEFCDWIKNKGELPQNSQIAREIDYFVKYYDGLEPHELLCYERSAFFANDDITTRITFDRNIRYRTQDLDLSQGANGKLLLPEGFNIMELKFYNAVPKFLSDIITELKIRPSTFSKYGKSYLQTITNN